MPEIAFPLSNISFAYPWMLFAPLLIGLLYFIRHKKSATISYPKLAHLKELGSSMRVFFRKPTLGLLASLFIIFLSIAAARPQHILAGVNPEQSRNIMLSLDISKSMSIRDFGGSFASVSRLQAVKAVVSEFIKLRTLDRLGLVIFGSTAYLQSPLTRDHPLLEQMVARLQVGMAGDGTAIGDGLGLALKRVEGMQEGSRAVILMTDGVSNSGHVNPIKAAKVARDLGVKVHTIGIGSKDGTLNNMPGSFLFQGSRSGGEFDEKTLREIAEITGGVYFNASDLAGLKKIYKEIDKLEKTEREEMAKQKIEEFFVSFLTLALICFVLYMALARTIFMKIP